MSTLLLKELKCSKYRLLGLVGQGQFGRVYCASHRKTGRLFALKELAKERFPTHKFLRELRFLLSLQHTNIVQCHALEHTQTGRYLVMDYCEGGTLRNLMTDNVQLHPVQSSKLIMDVLAGLEHAHSRGIIHCDIKPDNILLTVQPDGWTARISDFGIARLSQESSNSNTGSPAYMAPERFYGQHSLSSDLYAIGILLFELLIGDRPFSGVPNELMSAHLNQPVQLPDAIPPCLRPIILTALQKLPARRFQSAAEMRTAIQVATENLERETKDAWSWGRCLQPALVQPAQPCTLLDQEHLLSAIGCLAGEFWGASDRADGTWGQGEAHHFRSGALESQGGIRIYRVFGRHIGCESYSNHAFEQREGEEAANLPLVTVRLPESVEGLFLRPQGCFAATPRSVYFVDRQVFETGVAADGEAPLSLGLAEEGLIPSHPMPQLVTKFSRDFGVTIDPAGRWMATATQAADRGSNLLRICHLASLQSLPPIVRPPGQIFQLLALDSRHFATFAHGVDDQTGACITGTSIEVFTRRGKLVGSLQLSLPLRDVVSTPIPYRLAATEPGYPNTMVVIDLKPLRILRIGVDIVPLLLTATAWGYVLVAESGEIVLIDQSGQRLGLINGPSSPTAIASPTPYHLLIATWKDGQGSLQTIDLRQMDLDLVF